jgi:hypothetical protein
VRPCVACDRVNADSWPPGARCAAQHVRPEAARVAQCVARAFSAATATTAAGPAPGPRQPDRPGRTAGLATNAAATAVHLGHAGKAVQLGRGGPAVSSYAVPQLGHAPRCPARRCPAQSRAPARLWRGRSAVPSSAASRPAVSSSATLRGVQLGSGGVAPRCPARRCPARPWRPGGGRSAVSSPARPRSPVSSSAVSRRVQLGSGGVAPRCPTRRCSARRCPARPERRPRYGPAGPPGCSPS